MKRIYLFLLALCIVLSVCGCVAEPAKTSPAAAPNQTNSANSVSPTDSMNPTATTTDIDSNINLDSTFPIVKNTVAVEIGIMPCSPKFSADKNWLCTYLEKNTNLDITWNTINDNERMTLLLSSNDLPDAVCGYPFSANSIVQYGVDGGLLHNWDDLLQYCPAFREISIKHPEYITGMTANDGHIYGLPQLTDGFGCSGTQHFAWNTSWLKKVGMEMPTTLDDFYNVLCAFRDNDPNGDGKKDEIPWVSTTASGDRNVIFSAYGYVGGGYLAVDYKNGNSANNSEIVYVPYAKQYKDYLVFMNKLWKEGLLDPDTFTQTLTQAMSKCTEGNAGFTFMSTPMSYYPQDPNVYQHMVPLVDVKGDTPVLLKNNPVGSINYVISSGASNETANALAKFGDCFFTCEVTWKVLYGPDYGDADDYYGWGAFVENNQLSFHYEADATDYWSHCTTHLSWWLVPGYRTQGAVEQTLEYAKKYPDSVCGKLYSNGFQYTEYEKNMIANQAQYQVTGVPAFYMTSKDLERVTALSVDLDNYVNSMEAKFITGELPIDSGYNEFVQTLEKYGVKEYVGIYKTYYDTYLASLK